MICSKCGFENSEQAKFCSECGRPLLAAKTGEAPSPVDNDAPGTAEETVSPESADQPSSPETVPFDLPPIFNGKEEDSESDGSFEFDFSPIDEGELSYHGAPYAAEPHETSKAQDTSGFDEYLIGPDYVRPESSWKSGDTAELPRIDDKQPERKEYRAPDREEKRKPGRIIAAVALILIVVAALATAGVTYQMELWGGKILPDVEGMDRNEATAILEDRGFTVKSMQVKSDDEENIVLLMDPGPGRRLSEGSEVVLQVSTPRVIPEVIGKTLEEAEGILAQEGFERITYEKVKSDEAENTVLSIEPAVGEKAKASTDITVTVAEPYIVPETAGLSAAGAIEAIEAAGFVAAETYVYSEQEAGTVVQSDPIAGTKLASGSTVTVQIAKSRANELIGATQNYLSGTSGLEIGGTAYELVSVDGVSYAGGDTTTATVTVVGVTTLPDGEVVRGTQKQRTVTFTWGDDNSLLGYA